MVLELLGEALVLEGENFDREDPRVFSPVDADRREDHADRLDDDFDQDNACGARPGVPAPEDPDDEASDEKPDPDLSALAAAEIRRKGTRDDQEETERQEQDGHEIHNRIPDIEASHRISP